MTIETMKQALESCEAFPVSTRPMETENGFGHQDGASTWQYGGLTLRDYFAAKAMPILWDARDKGYCGMDDIVAEGAYRLADAMLKARGKE